MKSSLFTAALLTLFVHNAALAQVCPANPYPYSGPYFGSGSIGSSEPLFFYDDQEPWKHGYIKDMPYYEGYHSFRPYNYHHIFSQSATSQSLGMSAVMPYSQQFWHRYEALADLSQGHHEPVFPNVPPVEGVIENAIPAPPTPDHSSFLPPVPEFDKPSLPAQITEESIIRLQFHPQPNAPRHFPTLPTLPPPAR